MNAPNESTLTLEAIAAHFEQWRRRKKNGERIPEPLWQEAIDLLERYGVAQVTRRWVSIHKGPSNLVRPRPCYQVLA